MKDQDAPPQRQINNSQSPTSSHPYNDMGSNPYSTPPWRMEEAMMSTSSNFDSVDQETANDADFFGSDMSAVDFYSSSLDSSSLPHSPAFETSPNHHSPPQARQETNAQLPTSPLDPERVQESAITLSVSTAFNNGTFAGLTQPDLVLVSSDETLFYVHGTILSGTSFYTALTNLHSEPPADSTPIVTPYACPLPEDNNKIWVKVKDIIADELNIVLHALYNTSCAKHQPKFDTVARAIDKMASLFGLVVKAVIRLGNEFYNYILTITPLHPLRVYALAAHHRIHSLAVKASAHLLSYPIGAISDEESERMGAIYLRKLFLLQMERKERLIGLLFSPLRPHASVPGCGPHEQKTLKGLWTGALANLIYDLRADVSSTVLQRALEPLKTQIPCSQCVDTLQTKVNEIIGTWVSIRHTI